MKAALYQGQKKIAMTTLETPVAGDDDIVVKNLYASICGTDVAVYQHGPNTGHRITLGSEFGHEMVSQVVQVGKNVRGIHLGDRVYPYLALGKVDSRLVVVAVKAGLRPVDVLTMTYGQLALIGSGGYNPEDVRDVLAIMESGRWDIESIITQVYPWEQLPQAIEKASDVEQSLNVVIQY